MQRHKLIEDMTELLAEVIEENMMYSGVQASVPVLSSFTSLMGGDAVVTSLNLVSFITDIECMLDDDYGISIIIVDERALSRKQSPFQNVETLADFVLERVKDQGS